MNCGDKSIAKCPASALVSASTQDSKPFNKAKKDKKKKQHKDKKDSRELRESSTSANGVNKTKIGSRRKKSVSEITRYNYNKKEDYATMCPEPQKLKN